MAQSINNEWAASIGSVPNHQYFNKLLRTACIKEGTALHPRCRATTMSYTLVILFLCVGAVLAAGPECKDKKVSPEIRQQILNYHFERREGDAVEWDCGLEDKARGLVKKGGKIDTSKVPKGRGVNVYEIKKENETTKDLVDRALRRWWSSSRETNLNMRNRNNKKVGCSYKDTKEDFTIVCFFEKRGW
ncbi:SCP-like protein [Ancylostoma caninum]|uniref:SCP-like protein n=1 Tax=Ancylostoma caninum TaxID=29170 RepID=A0A368GSD9_ANCCA|nr:SCP-like protein [Ancylostoma caninum]